MPPTHARDANMTYKAAGTVVGMGGGLATARENGGLQQQTIDAARLPPKRPLVEARESNTLQLKVTRPSSPLRPSRDPSAGGCTRPSERQGEEAEPPEPARAVHLNSYSSQGHHRGALHAPHLGGLCPVVGAFGAQEACEGPRGAAMGYLPPHPLAYFKGQGGGGALPAVVAPPFVLHALMMQGQLVRASTPTGPHHHHHHQAPSAGRAGRFGEQVPSVVYPLRPFNTPQAYPAVTAQPSTKL